MNATASRRSRIYRWISALAWLLWLLAAPQAAWAGEILLVAEDSVATRAFADTLGQRRPQERVRFVALDAAPAPDRLAADVRVITLGEKALRWRLHSEAGPPTLVLLVSRIQAQPLLGDRRPRTLSLLWSDAPLERQLRLIKHLLPNVTRIGLPHSAQAAFLLPEARQAAAKLQLSIVAREWADPRDTDTLKQVLLSSDVLLGIDDPAIYNAATAKSLLLTSYAKGRPLVGPTAAFVKAGSLTTSYSDQQDWLDTLDELLDRPSSTWPRTLYPSRFKVVGNRQVARSLGIRLIDERLAAQSLAEGERR
ncbi:ABC transporter substrate-binding protein [Stutzerimonas tarimensis]|uniref:ABC transporter substrate-binding protein n=1 Tax=Stutzerimonas tarimensis TaxID=1507735 RepID=A0ABV7T9K2_9GAMM